MGADPCKVLFYAVMKGKAIFRAKYDPEKTDFEDRLFQLQTICPVLNNQVTFANSGDTIPIDRDQLLKDMKIGDSLRCIKHALKMFGTWAQNYEWDEAAINFDPTYTFKKDGMYKRTSPKHKNEGFVP